MTTDAMELTPHASRTPSIEIRSIEKIVATAAIYGVARDPLVRDLPQPDKAGRIPFAHVQDLYERAALLTNEDAFGLRVAERVDPGAFDLLGYLVSHCRTLDDTFDRLVRFHSIWNEGVEFRLDRSAHQVRLTMEYRCGVPGGRRQDAEMNFATVVLLGRRLTGRDWTPSRVCFQHPAPASTCVHERIFRCPIEFDAEQYCLVLPHRIGALAVLDADEHLGDVLATCAMRLDGRKTAPSPRWTAAVREAATRSLPDAPISLSRVASALGLSSRTLQRRLEEEGTSFNAVLQATRRDLAEKALLDGGHSVADISDLLGYSEPSALARAFRRWHGEAPRRYARRGRSTF